MSAHAPPLDAMCGAHADVPATFTCPRCGTFGCATCDRRTRPDAVPMCPECWDRREQVAAPARTRARLQQPNLILGLGIAAVIPCFWPMQLGSIVVGLYALSKLPSDAPVKAKRNIMIGIALGCLGALGSMFVLATIVSGP